MEMKVWDEIWEEEAVNRRLIDPTSICSFGIKALDDALIGILKNDLVIIGADSGVGKSEICLNMALYNAQIGKTVGLYYIEGGAEEAIARIKWRAMKEKYYSSNLQGLDMDYRKWRLNILDSPEIRKLEWDCLAELKEKIKDRLHIYSFSDGFTVDDLNNSLGWFASKNLSIGKGIYETALEIDLIIVDHLQYFTLTNPKQELSEMTNILTKVKNITNFWKIPVVLVSHLRKKEKDRGLPSQEDFYGTSNIAKISSLAVTISNHATKEDYANEKYPTFFRIVKSRTGVRSSYAMLCNFDFKKNEYDKEYEMHRLVGDKPLDKPMDYLQLPKWARENKKPYYPGGKNEPRE